LPASQLPDALTAGIALVKEGDFEAAIVELDSALGRLEPVAARSELAQGYLYLGIAYLELDQEGLARGKFAQALAHAPELRLDPSEFSPQVIRVFEATRQEAPRANTRKPAGPDAPASEAKSGRGSSIALLVLGAAAASGLALSAGGGAPAPAAGPSPSPPPASGPSPRPEPTPSCSYRASPRSRHVVHAGVDDIVCNIGAPAGCVWSAVSTNPNWLVIVAGARGAGDDEVRVKVRPNLSGSGRTASIQLVEDDNAFCKVEQEAASSGGTVPSLVAWSSDLEVEGGAGRISVDGAQAALVGPGRSQGTHPLPPGSHRIEALLSTGRGEPGVWRFRFGGAFRPGSLRLRAGAAASVSSEAIVFRLRGAPGERVVFDLDAGR
jgi:hypothetical protein